MATYDQRLYSKSWHLSEVVKVIEKNFPDALKTKYVVNYGAADIDGGTYDPTFDLFEDPNFGGLLIDGQKPNLLSKYPKRENVKIRSGANIQMTTIESYLVENNVPKDLTVVKIDIDSYECNLVRTYLASEYKPKIFFVEFNPTFPLPLRFGVDITGDEAYETPIWMLRSPFYGCSLALLTDILVEASYELVEIDGWDALFIHKDFAYLFQPLPKDLKTAYHAGYASRNSLHPECLSQDQKLFNQQLVDFANQITTLEAQDQVTQVHAVLEKVREFIISIAPNRADKSGKAPFYLSAHGPSDHFFKKKSMHHAIHCPSE